MSLPRAKVNCKRCYALASKVTSMVWMGNNAKQRAQQRTQVIEGLSEAAPVYEARNYAMRVLEEDRSNLDRFIDWISSS